MLSATILVGDAVERLRTIGGGVAQTCVTSPPYFGLRDYGHDGQIGLENSLEDYVTALVAVFAEVRRVLADDGTLWVNLGDSYGKNKQLLGIPWRVAFALQSDGWYLRSEVIWNKPNPMPESVTDRLTKSHETIFLLAKNEQYFYDHEAIKEPAVYTDSRHNTGRQTYNGKRAENDGLLQQSFVTITDTRNKRSVWTVTVKGYKGAHFATYPPALIEPCVLAGSREGDTVLDPFSGSGTTGEVALLHNRNYVGTELNPEYADISVNRITNAIGMLGQVTLERESK
jgi:DNA modification methylase